MRLHILLTSVSSSLLMAVKVLVAAFVCLDLYTGPSQAKTTDESNPLPCSQLLVVQTAQGMVPSNISILFYHSVNVQRAHHFLGGNTVK
jgi:hypothetical protein